MKVLALSDQEVSFIHSPIVRERFQDIDLIVSCGDLKPSYLEYIVTMLGVPMLYVPGNHDPDDYSVPGGINIDGQLITIRGISVVGFGGSIRYKPKGKHQYTQFEMRRRVWRLFAYLVMRPRKFAKGIDLLVTHAPPYGIHHEQDWAHTGFHAYHNLMRVCRTRFMFHGHSHAIRGLDTTRSLVHETEVINVYPYREIELD